MVSLLGLEMVWVAFASCFNARRLVVETEWHTIKRVSAGLDVSHAGFMSTLTTIWLINTFRFIPGTGGAV